MRFVSVVVFLATSLWLTGCSFTAAKDEYKLAIKHLPGCMKSFGGKCNSSPTFSLAQHSDIASHYAIDSLSDEPQRDAWTSFGEGLAVVNLLKIDSGELKTTSPIGVDRPRLGELDAAEIESLLLNSLSGDTQVISALENLKSFDFRLGSEEVVRGAVEAARDSVIGDCNVARFRRLAGHSGGDNDALVTASGRCAAGVTYPSNGDGSAEFAFKRAEFNTTFKRIETATSLDAYEYLSVVSLSDYLFELSKLYVGGKLQRQNDDSSQEVAAAYRALFLESTYLAVYFKGFFKNGDFFLVTFDLSTLEETIDSRLRKWFVKEVPGGEYAGNSPKIDCDQIGEADKKEVCKTVQTMFANVKDKSLDEIRQLIPGLKFDDNGKATVLGKLGEGGFVSRSGDEIRVPNYNVNIDLLAENKVNSSEVDFLAIGNDLIRVFTEAIGDSIFGVPSDPASTACKSNLLACFKESDPEQGELVVEEFVLVNEKAEKADAITRAAVGRAIRGISWFSLGNEALAEMIESFLAGASRKAIEKTFWCLEACSDSSPDGAQIRTVRVSLDD